MKIARYEDVVFSAQAVAHVAGSHNRDNPALIGNTGNEFDFRVLAGMPFAIADFPGFVDVQLGYRFRRDGPPNELRLDMTLGVRPFERLLLMLQSFNIVAPAAGAAGYPAMRQHKLQASAVLDFGKAYSVQAGAFTTVAARNARHEYGLISGVWYRF